MAGSVPEREMQVAGSLLDLVGNTPMVRLGRVGADLECDLLAKVELFNPGGSVKDRPAVAMIDAAERAGLLQPGGVIVEPTSGNTGVGLAIVAAQRGYRCIFVMSDKMSDEKVALLRRTVPTSWCAWRASRHRLTTRCRPLARDAGCVRPDQYSTRNPRARASTGPGSGADRPRHRFVAGDGPGRASGRRLMRTISPTLIRCLRHGRPS
jgi:cystathionine beta-synthase